MSDLNLNIWGAHTSFNELSQSLIFNQNTKSHGLVSVALASFLLALKTKFQDKPIIFITAQDSPSDLHKLSNKIQRIAEEVQEKFKVQTLPHSQVSLFEGISESDHHFALVSNTLSSWLNNIPQITLCGPKAITQVVCNKVSFQALELELKKGEEINLSQFSQSLVAMGYRREDTVVEVGTFTIRGEIIDVFPANSINGLPFRINLFGDEVENIRPFEPWTQRSIKSQEEDSIIISPIYPFNIALGEKKERLIEKLQSLTQEMNTSGNQDGNLFWQEDLNKFSINEYSSNEWQRFIPWMIDELDIPLSYIPNDAIVIIDEPEAVLSKLKQIHSRNEQELEHKIERGNLPASQNELLKLYSELPLRFEREIKNKKVLELTIENQSAKSIDLGTSLLPQFRANLEELSRFILENKNQNILISTSESSQNQLKESLHEEFLNEIKLLPSFGLDRGFSLGESLLFTDFELFGKKSVVDSKKKKDFRVDDFVPLDLNSIRIGDYLVHLRHGIGKFTKMKVIELDGQRREYITLEYHNGEMLNVPVDQMNLLTLYKGSSDGVAPKLSRLGGIDWEKTKNTVRKAVQKVAFDLLELYAQRSLEKGFTFAPDSPWQTELEDSFPYRETPDQIRAINEIKDEMESGYTMDRLLCGDVGFGKTEVIIRAAFKAIMSGKQVAVMAPTTILAQQHFKSFAERLGKFPVRMELMTRAKTGAAKKIILDKIKNGEVDLVIGTHALLGKSVVFKDLGLIIVDEEQKFGVNHKEKLKTLKANLSVLTVSATPIPRTMHMALSGIREMSLISTPPPGRVPIKTQTSTFNPKLIRAAIIHELERGGQVFYLHNRVESIDRKAVELMQLVPEASYKIAHGKMSETEITGVMEDFINHEADVLVATSIIENGIDIPNANTMIIENADRFGLSQLYQLRGRVGRSNDPSKPGFALLLHGTMDSMNEQARARLETISRYSNLGSGYQIALRDMEIRGVGNLLGAEQHGKMVSVGFELYCEMLNEAITEIKQKIQPGKDLEESEIKPSKPILSLEEKPVFDFKLNAYIPIDWIPDDSQRIREYQRLSEVTTLLQLTGLSDEWSDRFGALPLPVCELIKIVKLRLMATEAGIYGLIRPKGSFIELNARISFSQWKKLQEVAPAWLKERIAIRMATQAGENTKIMARIHELDVQNQLDLLEELFKDLIQTLSI
ncbi:MAG: transcription-repair coupling factor [Candidatus Caenarcaniphilales bacterium]|nr:transcription-repair coupling factor [Candidatus Caenarcaniphilales bacterium]